MRILPIALAASVLAFSSAAADDPLIPEAHFPIDPARLDPAAAERAYQERAADMADRFAASGDPTAMDYQGWWRANRSPYLSAAHGSRYVNNYVNPRAEAYGNMPAGTEMPVGSIIAKDAITVTEGGRIWPGALSIMEKMPAGYAPAANDWRYALILPDGSLFADSNGPNAEGTTFCVTCHQAAGEATDHLFLVPAPFARSGR